MRFPLSDHRVSYRLCHPAWVACPSADLARREASPWRLKMLEIRSGTASQTHVKDWETFKDAHPSLPRKEWTRSSCRRILLQLSMVGLRELNLWKWNERSKPCFPHAIIYTLCTLTRILTYNCLFHPLSLQKTCCLPSHNLNCRQETPARAMSKAVQKL